MRKKKHLHRKCFSLSSLQIDRLNRMVLTADMSLSEIVRQAIDQYLDQREPSLGLAPINEAERLSLKDGDS